MSGQSEKTAGSRPPRSPWRFVGPAAMAVGAAMMFQSCRLASREAAEARLSAVSGAEESGAGAFTGEVPPLPPDFVVDPAGAFGADGRAAVSNEIAALEAATGGGQMAVAAFTTLSGIPAEDAALRLARAWKLGRAGADDGALLLVATRDREVRLEIGLGWEGAIPDARAGDIVRAVSPHLAKGDWSGAAAEAVRLVRAAVSGEPVRPEKKAEGGIPLGMWGILVFFAGFVTWIAMQPNTPGGGGSGGSDMHCPSVPRGGGSRGGGFRSGGMPRHGGGGRFGGGGAGGRF